MVLAESSFGWFEFQTELRIGFQQQMSLKHGNVQETKS